MAPKRNTSKAVKQLNTLGSVVFALPRVYYTLTSIDNFVCISLAAAKFPRSASFFRHNNNSIFLGRGPKRNRKQRTDNMRIHYTKKAKTKETDKVAGYVLCSYWADLDLIEIR